MAEDATSDPLIRLSAAQAASGGKVDPATTVAVAKQASSVDEATTNIQAIAHSGNIVQMYDTLGGMSQSAQASAWEGLRPAEQESLKAIGYKAPNVDALSHAGAGGQHGGFWSDIASGVTDAFGDTRHFVAHAADDTVNGVNRGLKDTLSGLGKPLSLVEHVYRAGHIITEDSMASAGMSPSQITSAE